jgi:phospho-N-acetylmuramoyl-pentapeptide-transferase
MILDVVRVFLPSALTFAIGIVITPFITHYLYAHQLWKKKSVAFTIDGKPATISASLHNDEVKRTPRMGGLIVWLSVLVTAVLISVTAMLTESQTFEAFNFISRNQTWIPLMALLFGALVGLVDDYLGTREVQGVGNYIGGGLSLRYRLLVVGVIGLLCALWFYYKLEVVSIYLPIIGELYLGPLFILLFVLVTLGTYAGGVIDGVDGLSGGVFAAMFSAYATIAFSQNQIDLAALCASIVGGLLAFLWFNIPPARFYMSETGTMGLTVTLAIVAFMTDVLGGGHGFYVLPIIALPLVLTVLSNIIQIASKKFRGKKVFLVAPLHNHFQALGWPAAKVTMRYWIVAVVCAILGIVLALV